MKPAKKKKPVYMFSYFCSLATGAIPLPPGTNLGYAGRRTFFTGVSQVLPEITSSIYRQEGTPDTQQHVLIEQRNTCSRTRTINMADVALFAIKGDRCCCSVYKTVSRRLPRASQQYHPAGLRD